MNVTTHRPSRDRAILAEDLLLGTPPAAGATPSPRVDHFARRLEPSVGAVGVGLAFQRTPPIPLFVAFLPRRAWLVVFPPESLA